MQKELLKVLQLNVEKITILTELIYQNNYLLTKILKKHDNRHFKNRNNNDKQRH